MLIIIERRLAQLENEKQNNLIQETLVIYCYFLEAATVSVLKKSVLKNFVKFTGKKNVSESFFSLSFPVNF